MLSSTLDRLFALKNHKTTAAIEFSAAFSTFATLAYIIIINPTILEQAGMPFDAVMVATALSACFATFFLGILTNYPFAVAPGMGLNTYFAYDFVIKQHFSWEVVLAGCFIANFILVIFNILGVQKAITEAIPITLRRGTTAGIGLFILLIGLKKVNIIVDHPIYIYQLGNIFNPKTLIAIFGVILLLALVYYRTRAPILKGILTLWILGFFLGYSKWQGLVSFPPSVKETLFQFDLAGAIQPQVLTIIFSFIFVQIFDAAGTLISLAEHGEFETKEGKVPKARQVFMANSVGSCIGAMLGTSPLTTYLESAAGISEGGRTGLVAVIIALLFFISLFFSPLINSIPDFATTPALIVIGAMMTKQVKNISWKTFSDYVPSLLICLTIPLSFSIYTGIGVGFLIYVVMKLFSGKKDEMTKMIWVISFLFLLKFAIFA